jgi:hypothetical protein
VVNKWYVLLNNYIVFLDKVSDAVAAGPSRMVALSSALFGQPVKPVAAANSSGSLATSRSSLFAVNGSPSVSLVN